MQVSLNFKDISHNTQITTDCGTDKIQKSLSVYFLNKNSVKIEKLVQDLKEESAVSIPERIFLSVAKVKVAFLECLNLFEYEFVPNYEDLKDFTGGAIDDTDIANYEIYKETYTRLDDVCTNDIGEEDLVFETIDNGEYAETEQNDIVYEALEFLSQNEKELLMHRFGLGDYDELDIPELSKLYAVSEEEIESKVNTALANMKSVLETMM